jgi:acyl-CoA synthetase (NDP forming)
MSERAVRPTSAQMATMLAPRSIAVVGASSDPSKFGGRFVPTLLRHRYAGTIHPINSGRREIGGLPSYPDLLAVPGDVDCVIYSIGAEATGPVLEACEAKHVKLVVVTSAGFAETGSPEGIARQRQLAAFAQRTGIRILGPNCVGFVNAIAGVAAAAAAALEFPSLVRGDIGVVSQSGGLALGSMLYAGLEQGIGFSHLVSSGNEADLDLVDFAAFLVDDAHTGVIALTLEAVRDGAAFRGFLARAAEKRKPVLVLKSGRSALGQAMAASHTGALAGSPEVFAAVCRAHGATLVDDVDELLAHAQAFSKLRRAGKLAPAAPPVAERCAALSVSGGHVGLMADLGAQHGLGFPPLSPATQAAIAAVLQKAGPVANPVDLSGGMVADHSIWGRTLEALLADPAVGVAMPILTVARNYDPAVRDFLRIAAASPKVVVTTWVGGAFEGDAKALLRDGDLPWFTSTTRATRFVRALDAWLASLRRARPGGDGSRRTPGLAAAGALFRAASETGLSTLGEWQAKRVLASLGVPVARETRVASRAEALAAAQAIGYPVALKGLDPATAHKTEAGLVHLRLANAADVAGAYDAVVARLDSLHARGAASIVVQEMVPPGVEILVGARRDPVFGPMVMVGLGGVFVEILRDVSLRPAPVSRDDALAMIGETRCAKLLSGARGMRPLDLDTLAQVIVEVGDFAVAHADRIAEIDVNPLIAAGRSSGDLVAVDALIVLDDGDARHRDAGMPREGAR